MLKMSSQLVCLPEKLGEHLQTHFTLYEIEPQPELTNPDDYPYVLPRF